MTEVDGRISARCRLEVLRRIARIDRELEGRTVSQPTVPQVVLRAEAVAILLAGMLVTAVVRGGVAVASIFNVAPVFGMFNVAHFALPSLSTEWVFALWRIDWGRSGRR